MLHPLSRDQVWEYARELRLPSIALVLYASLASVTPASFHFDRCGLHDQLVKWSVDVLTVPATFTLVTALSILLLITASGSRAHSGYAVGLVLLLNCNGYLVCNTLKTVLNDFMCHDKHANSVSGHFNFFVFYFLGFRVLVRECERVSNRSPRAIQAVKWTWRVFALFAWFTLYRTGIAGYHTPRQIVYGVFLAFVNYLFLLYLLIQPVSASATTLILVHTLAANVVGQFVALKAVTLFDYGLTVVCLGLVLASANELASERPK